MHAEKEKKQRKNRERKNTEAAKEKRRKSTPAASSAYSKHDGGTTPEEVSDDIPTEQLEQLKRGFYRMKVVITEQEAMESEAKKKRSGR